MGKCEPLTGDPVTKGQADWLTNLYATQIRLQAGRVTTLTRARADLPDNPDTVTRTPIASGKPNSGCCSQRL